MKNSLLTIKKRRNEILDLLQRYTKMTTIELSEKLHVSLSTIRRDLRLLEEKNEIIREHGYCLFNYDNQTNFDLSGPTWIKHQIARCASQYIGDYATVFINSSSTALATLLFRIESCHRRNEVRPLS